MTPAATPLEQIRAVNETAAFNRWCGIPVDSAEAGSVPISMPWRTEAGQYGGFLHAGVVGALLDTACGSATAAPRIATSQALSPPKLRG